MIVIPGDPTKFEHCGPYNLREETEYKIEGKQIYFTLMVALPKFPIVRVLFFALKYLILSKDALTL